MWLNFMNLFPPQKINFWGLILNAQHTQVELRLISFFGLSYFGDNMVCFLVQQIWADDMADDCLLTK